MSEGEDFRKSISIIFYKNIFKSVIPLALMAKDPKDGVTKRIFIAGAAAALNYKERNPHATESEVMSYVTREMKDMIKDIGEDN